MKEMLKRPLLIATGLTTSGLAINLLTYFLFGQIYLARQLNGGEWVGYQGFGVLLNMVYPITGPGEPGGVQTWLSIDPISFVVPFVAILLMATAIELLIGIKFKGYGKEA